jgi:glycerol-3-phosphate dehydrogenase
MDDARLCLENVLDARRLGARVLNACSLRSAHQLGEGEVRCRLRDEEAGVEREVRARLLVVCAGPWTDEVFRALGREGSRKVKATKGVHLVTRPLTADMALLVPARSSKRVFFVIPWRLEGKPASLVGTTDTDFSGDPAHLRAEDEDLAWLIEESARVLPGARLRRSDIWATFAGLRPLTAPPPPGEGALPKAGRVGGEASNSSLSREHVFHEEPGILAITGGKYTTYRALCQQLVEKAAARLGLPLGPAFTAHSPLPGAPKNDPQVALLATLPRALSTEFGMDEAAAASLVDHLGLRARDAALLCADDPDLKKPIAPGSDCPAPLALAAFSAEHEMVVHLEDFYLRRSNLGLRLPGDHRGVDRVAAVIGDRLWWSREREAEELEKLGRVVAGEYR